MVKTLLILSLLGGYSHVTYGNEALKERLNCAVLGTPANVKQQGQILGLILGKDTHHELTKMKFKHTLQLRLFMEEMAMLNNIRLAARTPKPNPEQAALETVQTMLRFMKDEKFLDPMKVCSCAYTGIANELAQKKPTDPVASIENEKIRTWTAKCIPTHFVPNMFENIDLEE